MTGGALLLDAVLEEARKLGAQLEKTYDVPVLLVVGEENEADGVTHVTGPGGPSKAHDRAPQTFVVPLQPRYPTAGKVRLSFGRATICDLVLPFSSISKHHGYFEQTGTGWMVLDVGSTNGTMVDDNDVGKNGKALTDGCALRLGHVSARFLSAKAFCAVLRQRLGT
jgi:hypothetical protein